MTQTIHFKRHDGAAKRRAFQAYDNDHTPSWMKYGKGSATLDAAMVEGAPWLSLIVRETGEKSWRQAFITLDREAVLALYAMLHEELGHDPAGATDHLDRAEARAKGRHVSGLV